MSGPTEMVSLQPLSLRFLDDSLETSFQEEEGASGIAGFRIITAATAILWVAAAFLVPKGIEGSSDLVFGVGLLMGLAGAICLVLGRWAVTMNHQHAIASMLTSANGLVIFLLANSVGATQGYAVGAIMLLYLFGFVSRTRFIHAAIRTLVIGAGFVVVVVLQDQPSRLLLDGFILASASAASLLGLRLIETNRRQVWYQRRVIEEQSAAIAEEKAESERLLLNILPAPVSRRLKAGENPIADDFSEVSVLFADIVGFTPMASKMSARTVITMLNGLFSHFDQLVLDRNVEKIKTIGDSYMAVSGLPEPDHLHASRMVDLAVAMIESTSPSGPFDNLRIRVGVHSGPVAGGVIGSWKFAYDVWGDTVNVAARLESAGVPGRVHVSERTMTLTKDVYRYEAMGPTDLRGVGALNTYLLSTPIGGRESLDSWA